MVDGFDALTTGRWLLVKVLIFVFVLLSGLLADVRIVRLGTYGVCPTGAIEDDSVVAADGTELIASLA